VLTVRVGPGGGKRCGVRLAARPFGYRLGVLAWTVWLSPWNWTSTDWAGVQCLVLVLAAIFAWRQFREARRLRDAQARPFVIIDLQIWQVIAEFKITNIGATLAREVRFEFKPPLRRTFDDEPSFPVLAETNLFKNGIPALPPGKEITVVFDRLPDRLKTDLPDDYEVRVSYKGPVGKRTYSETMTVGYGYRRETGGVHRNGLHEIHKELEKLVGILGKWGYYAGGIRVMTPEAIDRHESEEDARFEARAKAAQPLVETGAVTEGEGGEVEK
jgi:hypothetical protein